MVPDHDPIMSDAVPPGPSRTSEPPAPAQASLRQVAGAVFWSFFGVRKGKAMRDDAVSIRPHQVIVLGIVFAGLATLVAIRGAGRRTTRTNRSAKPRSSRKN